MENEPGLKMYFLLKMGIFQPAMLGYQRVPDGKRKGFTLPETNVAPEN